MTDFKIRRGLSTELFEADPPAILPEVISSKDIAKDLLLEEGTWYLCTDTAHVYVCVKENYSINLCLKLINAEPFKELSERLDQLEDSKTRYVRIETEQQLPTNFTSATFDSSIIYYIADESVLVDGKAKYIRLYIFNEELNDGDGGYFCTAKLENRLLDGQITDVKKLISDIVPSKINEALSSYNADIVVNDGNDLLEILKNYEVDTTLKTILATAGVENLPHNNSAFSGMVQLDTSFGGWIILVDNQGEYYTASLNALPSLTVLAWDKAVTAKDLGESVDEGAKKVLTSYILYGGNAQGKSVDFE